MRVALKLVLIVEDEILARMFLAEALSEAGYRVLEASTAEEAIAIFGAKPDIAALVTDVEFPGPMNGFELAWLLHRQLPELPIVVASGRTWPGSGVLPDACIFMQKPYLADELVLFLHERLAGEFG